jgi:hypothetical protein
MKYAQVCSKFLIMLVFLAARPVVAETAPDQDAEGGKSVAEYLSEIELPDVDLYRQPYVPRPTAYDREKSCRQLELELRSLHPQTYSYKPGFYEDPYQGAAIWVGTTMFWPAYGVLAWSAHSEYEEKGRRITAENRIAELRQLKADLRCFED